MNFATAPSADWTVLPDGWRVWRIAVTSQGATGIRVHLEAFKLPDGARLVVYDPAHPTPAAPITTGSLFGEQEIWAETIFAETAVVECQVPPGVDTTGVTYTVTGVPHLYRSPLVGPSPKAGSCENDVTCYSAWTEQAAGVARIYFVENGSTFLCTGCLLDTSPTTFIDYFLTANHCVNNQTVASTLEAYWFYQTTNCNGTPPTLSSVPHSSGGADFLAGSAANDFAFLRLRQASPGGVLYEGWTTASALTNETLTGTHHPGQPPGDYKRISFGNENSSDADFWQVNWFSGVTEQGSSGSPLFNSNQQVIGQLQGGASSCNNPSGIDNYGRFNVTYNSISQWLGPPTYQVIDLGTLGGYSSYAYGINNNGQVVGAAETAGFYQHAFLYSGGTMVDLGTLGGRYSRAQSINNNGQIVGFSTPDNVATRAFLYSGGTMVGLGTFGGLNSEAYGINDSNQIVGWADGADNLFGGHAFLQSGGMMIDLGILGGNPDPRGLVNSEALGINNNGQIAGWALCSGNHVHAFVYSGGTMIDLGTLGGYNSWANGINNNGQAVGYIYYSDNQTEHAFRYSGGTMTDLGTLGGTISIANGINNNGQIVGWTYNVSGYQHAFLYGEGGMVDLNSLIITNLGWVLETATAINDKNQIVGYGINPSGYQHAFLLTPAAPAIIKPPPPVLQVIAQTNGLLTLIWGSTAGQAWQLQYKTNLTQATWINQGSSISATNSTTRISTTIGPDSKRFYRILLVP